MRPESTHRDVKDEKHEGAVNHGAQRPLPQIVRSHRRAYQLEEGTKKEVKPDQVRRESDRIPRAELGCPVRADGAQPNEDV